MNEDLIVLPRRNPADGYHYVLVGGPYMVAVCSCPGWEFTGHCYACDDAKEIAMTTREVTVAEQRSLAQTMLPEDSELNRMITISEQLFGGSTVPQELKSAKDLFAVMLKGWELGAATMASLEHISIVNGKTQVDTQLMIAVSMAKEPDIRFEIMREDATSTTARLTRPSHGYIKEFTYTDAMATQAGLDRKPGAWQTHRLVMRQWAALKRLARVYCADLINGTSARAAFTELPTPPGIALPPEDPDPNDGAYEAEYVDVTPRAETGAPPPASEEEPGVVDVPMVDDKLANTIFDWQDAVRSTHLEKGSDAVKNVSRERWPYAVENDTFMVRKLTEADGLAYLDLLKAVHASRDGTVPQLF